jgi:DNA-directed RNA polymerase subunit K/omega
MPVLALGQPTLVNPLEYTRFEKARIVGARSLQLSMGAPPLIETPADVRNPVRVAMLEYESNAIPLTVQRNTVKRTQTAR